MSGSVFPYRGCTDDELVRVLSWLDGRLVPADYIEFLMERGVGPEIVLRGGSRWTLHYPGILDLTELVAGRLSWADDFVPFALESWDEGSSLFSTERITLYGFIDGSAAVHRLDRDGRRLVASSLATWRKSLEL